MVNFWFFGSIFDALEWEQVGIKNEEIIDFTNFLIELYSVYDFIIGGFAIEGDVLELLKEPYHFINIVWNEKYKELSYVPYNHKRLVREGILIEFSGEF